MTLCSPFDFVEAFAARAHAAQRYGPVPYTFHLGEVAQLSMDILSGGASRAITSASDSMAIRALLVQVAYLHDVIEDTPLTAEAIDHLFGPHVAGAVDLVTDPPGKNRRERKERLYRKVSLAHMQHTDPPPTGSEPADWVIATALIVKCADRLANLCTSLRTGNRKITAMYRGEQKRFRSVFYSPLCDPGWQRIEALLMLAEPIDPALVSPMLHAGDVTCHEP